MAGVSNVTPDKPNLRIVTVPMPTEHSELLQVTKGCRIINYKISYNRGTAFATFWIDVSGEEPEDFPVEMPDDWDCRSMMKGDPPS